MEADGREFDGKSAGKMDPSLCGFDELRDVGVARIEPGVRVDDADERSGKCVFAVAGGLDEHFSEEQREVRVSVRSEPSSQARLLSVNWVVKIVIL